MKIASTIARYLLAFLFTVMGLNGFLHFLPMGPMPPRAGQFIAALAASNYLVPVFLLQIASGLLFLVKRYVPLALTLIGPVIFNILLFHLLLNPEGILPGAIATICWFIVFYDVRSAFAGIFRYEGREPASERATAPSAASGVVRNVRERVSRP